MDSTTVNPNIPMFLANPYIQSIAKKARWTISDNNKRPVDIVWLIYAMNNPTGQRAIRGAAYPDERCLITLDELVTQFPNAANFAYHVDDAMEEGYVILDVEPTCPDDIRQWFLSTNYLYGEYSRSGKGIHLVYPMPACIQNYPDAQKKIKMQTDDKTYEFMLSDHYMTFTGNQLPPATGTNSIDGVFEDLCKKQVYVEAAEIDLSAIKPDIPNEAKILGLLKHVTYKKSLGDYHNDFSRYEFGACVRVYHQLERLLKHAAFNNPPVEYDINQKAWLVYQQLVKIVPHRDKHDETRKINGQEVPFLLFMAASAVSKSNGHDEDDEKA